MVMVSWFSGDVANLANHDGLEGVQRGRWTAYDSEIRSANNQRKVVENDIETIELFGRTKRPMKVEKKNRLSSPASQRTVDQADYLGPGQVS